jgi:hypothetical protein
MKTPNAKTKTEKYIISLTLVSKKTGASEVLTEEAYSFGKEDHDKITKDLENKYRGRGYRVKINSIN